MLAIAVSSALGNWGNDDLDKSSTNEFHDHIADNASRNCPYAPFGSLLNG
ncbi:hypothetical protein VCRA217O134_10001 [Vibrio crassostreae]|nr:hypothetical protein VCRA217O134_10001 [Vibrio crassostreae]